MNSTILYIGDKNLSSWSFRAWMGLKYLGFNFEERIIPLNQINSEQELKKISPTAKVPCLHHNDLVIWDSLAILEYAQELTPDRSLFPSEQSIRALARSIVCEMHSSFFGLRAECPMNMKLRESKQISPEADKDLERIYDIWSFCKQFNQGKEFLLGEFSIVDVFFAPVVSRIISYRLDLKNYDAYIKAVSNSEFYKEWERDL